MKSIFMAIFQSWHGKIFTNTHLFTWNKKYATNQTSYGRKWLVAEDNASCGWDGNELGWGWVILSSSPSHCLNPFPTQSLSSLCPGEWELCLSPCSMSPRYPMGIGSLSTKLKLEKLQNWRTHTNLSWEYSNNYPKISRIILFHRYTI